jgi:catechol 2,3-dioxygenase-like lactoylglutathione lyase family enzyme
MFTPKAAFSGFSVDDIDKAKQFYTDVLGLSAQDDMGGVRLVLPGGGEAWVYSKPDHKPASYTMLNFLVDNIDTAVDEPTKRGIQFEHYEGFQQDDKGIARGLAAKKGPDIAWFKDPAGNILAVLQDK